MQIKAAIRSARENQSYNTENCGGGVRPLQSQMEGTPELCIPDYNIMQS